MESKLFGVENDKSKIDRQMQVFDEVMGKKPDSVMLELPLNWEKAKDLTGGTHFFELGRIFEKQGVKVIPGDVNNHADERICDFLAENYNPDGGLDDQWKVDAFRRLRELIRYKVSFLWPFYMRKSRQKGFLERYNETRPEAVILGDMNAWKLKKEIPEMEYHRVVFGIREQVMQWLKVAL